MFFIPTNGGGLPSAIQSNDTVSPTLAVISSDVIMELIRAGTEGNLT